MTKDEFLKSLDREQPPDGIPEPLGSLWWDRKENWDKAHRIAQEIPTTLGSAVHAYLHREEGVLWNADYWYRRAGRERPVISLDNEWHQLVDEIISL